MLHPHHQTITLEEVAARAGVSAGTVSRVLNGKNKENRPAIARRSDNIRKIAMELGYKPNAAARSMLRGAFQAAAFMTCSDWGRDWFSIAGLNGIHSRLSQDNWRLIFNELPAAEISDPKIVPQLLQEVAVDGLIVNLLPPNYSEKIIDFLESQMFPCVWFNLKRQLRSVYPDDQSGSELAVDYLVNRGHQRIGMFSRTFSANGHYSVVDRYQGFRHAMQIANLPVHRASDIHAKLDPNFTLRQQAIEFLKAYPDVEAILCYEREEAVCLNLVASQLGRHVQTNLDLICFSESDVRFAIGIDAATMVIPFRQVGIRCVELLLKILSTGNREQPSISVPFEPIKY